MKTIHQTDKVPVLLGAAALEGARGGPTFLIRYRGDLAVNPQDWIRASGGSGPLEVTFKTYGTAEFFAIPWGENSRMVVLHSSRFCQFSIYWDVRFDVGLPKLPFPRHPDQECLVEDAVHQSVLDSIRRLRSAQEGLAMAVCDEGWGTIRIPDNLSVYLPASMVPEARRESRDWVEGFYVFDPS